MNEERPALNSFMPTSARPARKCVSGFVGSTQVQPDAKIVGIGLARPDEDLLRLLRLPPAFQRERLPGEECSASLFQERALGEHLVGVVPALVLEVGQTQRVEGARILGAVL